MNGKRWTNVWLKHAVCIAALACTFAPAAAQMVGGVEAVQVGTNLEIRYELDAPAEVSVWVSEDSGTSWTQLSTCLSGDYGKVPTAGRMVAVWDVLSCRESLVGSGLRFKVRTGKPGPCAGAERVTFDGYDYRTVAIGDQCWFAENLRSDNYRSGAAIPGNLTDDQWTATTAGAQAVYKNDPMHLATYGRLYNWYAVNDARGLCPSGWHVPSDEEWTVLTDALGGEVLAGQKMKSSNWGGRMLAASRPCPVATETTNMDSSTGLGVTVTGGVPFRRNLTSLGAVIWSLGIPLSIRTSFTQ
jgi:hypothetical protein